MSHPFTLEVDKEGIAYLTFDYPGEKVNKFSMESLLKLEEILEESEKNDKIEVMILKSGKKDQFIAGADLNAFKDAEHNPEIIINLIQTGHRVFNKLENLPFPTIAQIHGVCLGGGLECALSCTYRIASDHPKTKIGLPEVTLGIVPGWGGTQRLPRLVGLQESLKMILSGQAIDGLKAFKISLVDAFVPSSYIEEKAVALARDVITEKGRANLLRKRKKSGVVNWLLEKNPIGRALIFSQSKKNVLKKTKGHYPSPLVALDIVRKTHSMPLKKGLLFEQERFVSCVGKEFANASNLVKLFFIQESLKKQPEAGNAAAKPVSLAGVIGAGTMGGGIAWLFSYRGFNVRMKDINWNAIALGYSAARNIYNELVKRRRLKPFEADLLFHKIEGTVDYSGFKARDLIVEAAVENLDIKRQILSEMEKVIPADTVIGSNTSSLTISDMSRDMQHPERFVGMHFFNPVNRMPLVEIVAGPKSSAVAIATAVEMCKKLKKTPIVVGDCPGFLVNRIFIPAANELVRILQEGVPMKKIERAMLDFGMPMSPFLLIDEVGVDVTLKVAQSLYGAYGARMEVPSLLEKLYENKSLGKKSGVGFYIHQGKDSTPNPEVHRLVGNKCLDLHENEIVLRTLLLMINEAARCLDEGIINDPGYLDMAMIMGTGFPPFRGGLLRYADQQGTSWIKNQMVDYAKKYGPRFTPCSYMEKIDYEGRRFYS